MKGRSDTTAELKRNDKNKMRNNAHFSVLNVLLAQNLNKLSLFYLILL
jgi:hypothetical protein